VLFAHGSRFGGHALYVKDNRLHYVYTFVGMIEQKIVATEDIPTGEIQARGRGHARAGVIGCTIRDPRSRPLNAQVSTRR
jgi:hypothetical protein